MSNYYHAQLYTWSSIAKEQFKNFKAKFTQYDGISILDWKNRNGSGDNYIRFIFDEEKERMFVSGDLGHAVFHFTEKATLSAISRYSSLDYFMEKIVTTTDRWVYDRTLTKVELTERLKDKEMSANDNDDDDNLWGDDPIEELISDIMDEYDQYDRVTYLPDNISERLEKVDPDYYEWVYDLGKLPHPRVILWWQALKLAQSQVSGQS